MRTFNVLYVSDNVIRTCLNTILIVCDPSEKTPVHITVGGPNRPRPRPKRYGDSIRRLPVSVLGVGNFFGPNQNTVFLRCGSEYMKKIWDKPDFEFNPHITLYDGDSRDFALKLGCEPNLRH